MQTALSPQKDVAYDQFLQMKDEDTHAEWVNGEVVWFLPPKRYHQEVLRFLSYLLEDDSASGEFVFAPFELFLPKSKASREPDLIVVLRENLSRLTDDRVTAPVDVVGEVISEDSVRRDSVDKFLEYEREGIREYWLIDPRPGGKAITIFSLQEGSYVPVLADQEGWLNSAVLPRFRLKQEWFTGEALPDPRTAWQEMREQI